MLLTSFQFTVRLSKLQIVNVLAYEIPQSPNYVYFQFVYVVNKTPHFRTAFLLVKVDLKYVQVIVQN